MAGIKRQFSFNQKDAVQLTTDLEVRGAYVTINVSIQRRHIINKGAENERELASDYQNESVQLQFEGETLDSPIKGSVEDLIKQAIAQAEAKYQ